MGQLIEGRWQSDDVSTANADEQGHFVRSNASFRSWVTRDGSPGPTGEGGFRAEPGRYHLYVSWACPWAHRTLILRKLKGLESVIGLSVTHWLMGEEGWTFDEGEGVVPDTLNGCQRLHEIYTLAKADYTGRVTVPVLWDAQRRTIVNNESADIIVMLNDAFDAFATSHDDYHPASLRKEIEAINREVYERVNNGVYRAGFATTQAAYEEACRALFETLSKLDERLVAQSFLVGEHATLADWRLFTTLVRFDPVYHVHFKCNIKRLTDFPNLFAYARRLHDVPGVASTVNMHHIKHHYYESQRGLNPHGIVPLGPAEGVLGS